EIERDDLAAPLTAGARAREARAERRELGRERDRTERRRDVLEREAPDHLLRLRVARDDQDLPGPAWRGRLRDQESVRAAGGRASRHALLPVGRLARDAVEDDRRSARGVEDAEHPQGARAERGLVPDDGRPEREFELAQLLAGDEVEGPDDHVAPAEERPQREV